MLIHAGGFINGTKDHQDMQFLCDSFARRGSILDISPYLPMKIVGTVKNTTFNEGAITLTVTNGTAPLKYFWSNNQTTKDTKNLTPNTYCVTITDDKAMFYRSANCFGRRN